MVILTKSEFLKQGILEGEIILVDNVIRIEDISISGEFVTKGSELLRIDPLWIKFLKYMQEVGDRDVPLVELQEKVWDSPVAKGTVANLISDINKKCGVVIIASNYGSGYCFAHRKKKIVRPRKKG